jgi:hypothetical protein
MSFKPTIPNASDFLSISQVDMLQNFSSAGTIFQEDHVALDDGESAQRGKHNKVTFVQQVADPVTGANEVDLYTKDVAGQPEIFFAPESAAAVTQITKGARWQPGLRVEAFVMFDRKGNILQSKNGERQFSFNVTSVTKNGGQFVDDWTVNFTSNISTANYFWVMEATLNEGGGPIPTNPVVLNPVHAALYSTSVTPSSFNVAGYFVSPNINGKSTTRVLTVRLTIYTVG